MTTAFASGSWLVRDGSQAAFVDRWSKFLASTTATVPGLHWAVLLADTQDSRHFVSVAEWDSAAQREAWRAQPHFPAQMGACRELCEEFRGADYSLAASVRPGEKNSAP
jgi:heme-degrading monooxygenase HmoA